MDSMLIIVSGLSLALAGGMGALLVRMRREERRRSDARVALLEQLAASGQPAPRFSAVERVSEPRPSRQPDLELRPEAPAVSHELFHEHQAPAAWPGRFAVAGALMAVVAVVFLGWTATRPVSSATPAPRASAPQAVDQPLELLSLQHDRQPSELVITGLVQNPRDAVARSGIQATVQLFSPGGEPLTSGRAPLDFTTLSPGDESPFVIRVPVSSPVARYRVGFRGENDRVLGHVDRRNPETIARKQAP